MYIKPNATAKMLQCFSRRLPQLLAAALLLVSASVWANSGASVVFDDYSVATSDFRIDMLRKSPQPQMAGTAGVQRWEKWCFRITSLQDTDYEPGEFTHFGVHITSAQHQYDSDIQNAIEASMSVNPNDGDYSKDYKSSGGPLNGYVDTPMVLWNNNDDHVRSAGESAKFCYAAPEVPYTEAMVGLKVGGDRRSATLKIVPSPSVPTLPFYMLLLLGLALIGLAFKYQRKPYQQK